jgi:hypothetical protein
MQGLGPAALLEGGHLCQALRKSGGYLCGSGNFGKGEENGYLLTFVVTWGGRRI